MPPKDNNPDELEDVNVPKEPQEAGEFTRAFGGRTDKPGLDAPSVEKGPSPQPGSLTNLLGGKSKPADKSVQSPPFSPGPPTPPPAHSFTVAFDGVNAFTRNPADLGEDRFKTEIGKQPRSDVGPTAAPDSFTRLFGSGEGVLTPSGPEDDIEKPRPPAAPKPSRVGLPGFPQSTSAPGQQGPSRPAPPDAGSFTEAFRAQPPLDPLESKMRGGSFTEQFESPSSWPAPEPPPPSGPAQPYPPGQGASSPLRHDEAPPLGSLQRPPTPPGGFTRLIDPLKSDSMPLPDATRPSMPAAHLPQRPLPDPNYGAHGSAPPHDATIVFNQAPSPEPEFAASPGKSEYTRVMDGSKFRPPAEPYRAGSPPPAAGPSAAPPVPIQYPPAPQPPAWPPAPAPPQWTPPQMAPPPMPQPPAFAAPALAVKPPTLGDQLVSFLPLILTLSVVNFLGLLAVLIVLFATRK